MAETVAPGDLDHVAKALASAPPRGVLPRGLGRAYGDAAQNAGGLVLDMSGLSSPLSIGPTGLARAGAATSIDDLIRTGLAQGWFVPVTPGTRMVSIGGAVAADIHGKNHHRDGSFMSHVRELCLVTPEGEHRLTEDDDLFWATAGGMGLTGVVTGVELQMVPVPSSWMLVDTDRTTDLDETLAVMSEGDESYRYSVCWIDCLSRGGRLGRGIVTRADHAPVEALPTARRRDPHAFSAGSPLAAPPWVPSGLVNLATVSAFNEAWYRRAPRHERGGVESIASFFHPLDGIRGWNRMYGRRGFLQYQVLLPFEAEDVLRRLIERLSSDRCPSLIGVLKRFGPGDRGHLSFPAPGWTLAIDIPVGPQVVGGLLDELDGWVVDAGGRIYLAKDSRMRPELVEIMYPRLPEWREIRDRTDPNRVMTSDLSRRLGLVGPLSSGRQFGP
jgi:decaprenylphospho-beta-D-ribofuranose 2-oxidase